MQYAGDVFPVWANHERAVDEEYLFSIAAQQMPLDLGAAGFFPGAQAEFIEPTFALGQTQETDFDYLHCFMRPEYQAEP